MAVMRMLRSVLRRRGGATMLGLGTTGLLLLTLLGASFIRERAASAQPLARHTAAQTAFGHVPLAFERNDGQADSAVRFLTHGNGYLLALTDGAARLTFAPPATTSVPSGAPVTVSMAWPGASASPQITGERSLPGIVNYFIGNDSSHWHPNVPTFQQVRYHNLYPGVDLVYYGQQGAVEYDFVVAPGADPSPIQLAFSGQQNLSVDLRGNLVLTLPGGGTFSLQKPSLYQQINGTRHRVSGSYHLGAGNQVRFSLGTYDHTAPLVIDPVFIYSTFLGGNGTASASGVATDGAGDTFVAGTSDPHDAFVTELNAAGNAVIFTTYVGGSANDGAAAIAVDGVGNVYLTGNTSSSDFPTVNPVQGTYAGNGDAFVSKLNTTGSALTYSTFLGGTNDDFGNGIAVDASGNAYVTGTTDSTDFPLPHALQSLYGGNGDAFVGKLSATGTSLTYSTYLGGSADDEGTAIAVDGSGNAYVTGVTSSINFPIHNPLQATNKGGAGDVFVSKLNASGSALVYSTYLGGSFGDRGYGIAVDSSGSAYVTGSAGSTDFPTTVGAFQRTMGGIDDAFVAKLSPAGSSLVYSTYLGGLETDLAYAIAVDRAGDAYLTGQARSVNFPLARPVEAADNSTNTYGHVFISELNPAGSALLFSTYMLGNTGGDSERGVGIAVDSAGTVYVAGDVNQFEGDFSVTSGAYQLASGTMFAARLQPAAPRRNPTAGVYQPSNSTFYLRNSNSNGYADISIAFGATGDIPVVGDWTGKGYDSVGVYHPSNNTFYLRNSNTTGLPDIVVTYGASGDIPIVGDWTGKGYDSVGVYRPSTQQFLLRNSNTTGPSDIDLTYGIAGDVPLIGDWTGKGFDSVGIYRPSEQAFYLRNSNTTGTADIPAYSFGASSAIPLVGDWLSQGIDTPAYVVASSATGNPFQWSLRYLNLSGPVQAQFLYGASPDTPLAGQWQPGP